MEDLCNNERIDTLLQLLICHQHQEHYFDSQDVKDNERALFYLETRKSRSMRKYFTAMCVFVYNFKKSKIYWSIVLNKMDSWMKKRTYRRWIENANLKRCKELGEI